jgi:KDO2-lipid IV(A) lauroyltransferase
MPSSSRKTGIAGVAQRLRWATEAAVYDACAATANHVSPQTRLAIGSGLGTAFWALGAPHRRAARRAIALALGHELSPHEIDRLARASMRHFARLAVETLTLRTDRGGALDPGIRVDGMEHLWEARAKGRGLLGFSGHFGNWEVLRFAAACKGMPSTPIARPLTNPLLDDRLRRLREEGGARVFAKRGAVQSALAHVREGGFVSILIDQRPARSGMPVTLFGRRAFVADALAVLAIRTGAPIVPGFGFLETDGSWHVVIEPEVPVVLTGDRQADSRRIMVDCTAILERWIRRYPEQWLWTHARFDA